MQLECSCDNVADSDLKKNHIFWKTAEDLCYGAASGALCLDISQPPTGKLTVEIHIWYMKKNIFVFAIINHHVFQAFFPFI